MFFSYSEIDTDFVFLLKISFMNRLFGIILHTMSEDTDTYLKWGYRVYDYLNLKHKL